MRLCVGGADQRANARTGQKVNWDCIFFEDSQHSQMRDAARKASSKRHAHNGTPFFMGFAVSEAANPFHR